MVYAAKAGAVAVAGPNYSGLALAAASVAAGVGVPLVSAQATSPELSEPEYSYFYRVCPSDSSILESITATITHFRWRRLGIIAVDSAYGHSGMQLITKWAASVQVVILGYAYIPHPTNVTGTTSQLKGLAAAGSRVQVTYLYRQQNVPVLVEAAAQAGIYTEGSAWLSVYLSVQSTRALVKSDAFVRRMLQGYLVPVDRPATNSKHTQFAGKWVALNSSVYPGAGDPNTVGLAAWGYDSAFAIAHALDAGDCIVAHAAIQ